MEKSYTYHRATTDTRNDLWRHSATGWERLGKLAWRSEVPDCRTTLITAEEAAAHLFALRADRLVAGGASTDLDAMLDEERGGIALTPADVAKQRELEGLLIGLTAAVAALGAIVAVGVRQRHASV